MNKLELTVCELINKWATKQNEDVTLGVVSLSVPQGNDHPDEQTIFEGTYEVDDGGVADIIVKCDEEGDITWLVYEFDDAVDILRPSIDGARNKYRLPGAYIV